jgi:hypothetical protein
MRVYIAQFALVVVVLALMAYAAEGALEPGWSAVEVRVVEYGAGRPVAGARIETTCSISRYVAERLTTDENGRATIPIYRTWVGLRVTHPAFTNTTVTLVGTNKVTAFCTNAVIKLGRLGR